MHKIEYRRPARKALLGMPKALAKRFLAAFEQPAQDPWCDDLDVKPMTGREGYRLRIGPWRALYLVENERLVIVVLDIGPRGGI